MKLACLAKAMLFGSVLMLPLGCGGSEDESGAGTAENLTPDQQKMIKGYGTGEGGAGRYGPGGQDKPGETGGGKAADGKDEGGN